MTSSVTLKSNQQQIYIKREGWLQGWLRGVRIIGVTLGLFGAQNIIGRLNKRTLCAISNDGGFE